MIYQREMLIGWTLAAVAFGGLMWSAVGEYLTTPTPYRGVDILDAHIENGQFFLTANFTKTDCTFVRLSVVADGLSGNEVLEWSDVDELEEYHDRSVGQQTLRIVADLNGQRFTGIEVRTRHDCDGQLVDRVFMRFDL